MGRGRPKKNIINIEEEINIEKEINNIENKVKIKEKCSRCGAKLEEGLEICSICEAPITWKC